MKVAVVAVDGMFDSGLSVVLDVLSSANALRSDVCGAPPPIEVIVVGLGESVTTGHGLRIHTTPARELEPAPDVVVMPAPGVKESHHVIGLVAGHPMLSWINGVAEQGAALAAACTGTFFLAEAGVLDGLRATTSWWLGPAFRKRYRAVDLRTRPCNARSSLPGSIPSSDTSNACTSRYTCRAPAWRPVR